MSLYESSIPLFAKMLTNLDNWLGKATAHAEAKKFDTAVLLQSRLAPDQYPLVRQIQAACDAAKFAAARLGNKEPPKNPDTEQTFDEIRARIRATLAFLETVKASDFEGADKRLVPLPFMQGKGMLGLDYLNELAIPNFLFHVTHSYAILRHNGVSLGKNDFIGSLKLRDV